VDARVPAACADVAFEGCLLSVVEHVAGGAQPDHDVVPGEVRVGERRGILSRVDREVVLGAELSDRGHSSGDRGVPECCGLRED
jgi:hypothetical protein